MMAFLQRISNQVKKGRFLSDGRLRVEDFSIREYITQVILKLLGGALGLFTTIIFISWWAGELTLEAPIIMAIIDLPFVLGLWLVDRGKWQTAGYLPPATFFLLALLVNYNGGLLTTAILFYAISILLAGMLQGNKAQFLVLGLSILAYPLMSVYQNPVVFDDLLPPLLTVSGSLFGIALLQWLSNSRFHHALAQAYASASKLEERSTELAKSNEDLQQQISARLEVQNVLQETERTLSTLMGNLPGMAYRCRKDRDWTMEFVSEGCLSLTGYLPGDLILNHKISYNQIIHFDDRELVSQRVEAVLLSQTPFESVYRIRTADGKTKWVWEKGRGILSPEGDVLAIEGFITDVSDQIQKEIDLARYAERLKVLHEIDQSVLAAQSPAAIARAGLTDIRKLIPCRRASITLFNFESNDATIVALDVEHETDLGEDARISLDHFSGISELKLGGCFVIENLQAHANHSPIEESLYSEGVRALVKVPILFQGTLIGSLNFGTEEPGSLAQEQVGLARELADSLAIAIKNSILLQDSQQQAQILGSIYETALVTSSVLDPEELLHRIYHEVAALLNPDTFLIVLFEEMTNEMKVVYATEEGKLLDDWIGKNVPLESGGLTGWVLRSREPLLLGDLERDALPIAPVHGARPAKSWLGVPLHTRDRLVGALSVQSFKPNAFTREHLRFLESLATQLAISLENARLFEEIRKRASELEALTDISQTLRTALTVEEMLPDLLRKTSAAFGACIGSIYLLDQETGDLVAQAWSPSISRLQGHRLSVGNSIAGQIATAGKIHITENMAEDPWNYLLPYDCGGESTIRTGLSLPLRTNEYIVGVMHFGLQESPFVVRERIHLATTIADMAALAIWRANLFEETQRRFEHLLVLRNIDRMITSTMELRPILDVLLDQIAAHLHVDAATILLLAPHTQTLDTAARRGFNTPALLHTHLPLGDGFAGRAALERRVIHIGDLSEVRGDLDRADLFVQEGFASYFAFPLVAKGQVKGVLELFLRLPFAPDQEWLDFLDALATQAAIAIDNVELFESMQSANYQLVRAYEATIEGWSKALELRDQETEGHSQRVTEMTLRLARDMGIGDEELVHIRRGTLLHDIGKMAIPDHILLKPGPLTEDEWEIMRRHPIHAYELLSPIAYLRPALDIPYCHHEKWDGSGYPRRLKGEQIPLSARVFAVVDVWDALSSDRPYRKAWTDQEIIEYIWKESGQHFDPGVVKVFFSYFDQSNATLRLDIHAPLLPVRHPKS